MGCYGALALAAVYTLEPIPRTIVLLVLGALAVKTWIVRAKAKLERDP